MSAVPTGKNRSSSIKSWLKVWIAPMFAALLIKTSCLLVRWRRNDFKTLHLTEPVICAFWHGRQLMIAPLYSSTVKEPAPAFMLISSHADGRLIAKAVRWFGISAVFGSSSRNGAAALLQLSDILSKGGSVAITPDGPRGPIHQAKYGVVKLASVSRRSILPVSFSSSAYWQFKSWDQMILPKPFSKGVCIIGDPIIIPVGADEAALRNGIVQVEHALTSLNNRCDTYFS